MENQKKLAFVVHFLHWAHDKTESDYIAWMMDQDYYWRIMEEEFGFAFADQVCQELENGDESNWSWFQGVFDSYEIQRFGRVVEQSNV